MTKIFKLFLVFIVFFNFLFFSFISDSSAFNSSSYDVGAKDRLRSILEVTQSRSGSYREEKSILYTYSEKDGFSCTPGGILSVGTGNGGALGSLEALSWNLFVEVILAPLLCINTFNSIAGLAEGKGLRGSIMLLLTLFVSSGIEQLNKLILGEDDFNLDTTNKTASCSAIYYSSLAICTIMFIIVKVRISVLKKIVILLSISGIFYLIKSIVASVYYEKAKNDFYNLSLCGDDWFTYGSDELKKYLDENMSINNNNTSSSNPLLININQINYSNTFPTKGPFVGSYKYKIDSCFANRNVDACRELMPGVSIVNSDDISVLTTFVNKAYREYVYGGIEYSNSECTDPRPERKSFKNANDKTSQLYYFRGTDQANFACERFLVDGSEEYQKAYKCCLEASQKLVCIRYKKGNIKNHVMCDAKNSESGQCSLNAGEVIKPLSDSEIDRFCSSFKGGLSNTKEEKETDSKGNDSGDAFSNDEKNKIDNQYEKICGSNSDFFSDMKSTTSGNKISFKIVKSESDSSSSDKYCVETYNLCPYNFKILGGTEKFGEDFVITYSSGKTVSFNEETNEYYEDFGGKISSVRNILENENRILNCSLDEDGNKRCLGYCYDGKNMYSCFNRASNFCQIDRHCTNLKRFNEEEEISGAPYISKACINSVGSSHNFINYETHIKGYNNSRLFTAPLVECIVETSKNIILNKAGHTKCILSKEKPYDGKRCYSGEIYIEGEDLAKYDYESPFIKIKKFLYPIIKVFLAIAIVLYGYAIIIKNKGFSPLGIMKFVLSSVFVVYFTLSTNWINTVFNGVYTVSNYIVTFSGKIMDLNDISSPNKSVYENEKYSGCYFFNHDEINNRYEDYKDKSYLALFDTIDCKLSRYFGFSSEMITTPPLLSLFLAGLFSFGLITLAILPILIIFMDVLILVIRLAYQFIFFSLELTILLFISPLIIPLYLWEKTSSYFDNWLNQVIVCIFKPMFLVLSIMFFLSIFDKFFVLDAKFYGTKEPIRDLYCGKICKYNNGNSFYYIEGDSSDQEKATVSCLNDAKGTVVDLSSDAPICLYVLINKITSKGSSLFDMMISGFSGLPALTLSTVSIFNMFINLMFLILLSFVFGKFIDSASSFVFDAETNEDFKKLKKSFVSGLISISNFSGKLSKKMTKDGVRSLNNTRIKNNEKKALRNSLISSKNNGKDKSNESPSRKDLIESDSSSNIKSPSRKDLIDTPSSSEVDDSPSRKDLIDSLYD